MLSSERGLSSASGSIWAERSALQPSRRCNQNPNRFSCDARYLPRLARNGNTLRVKAIDNFARIISFSAFMCKKNSFIITKLVFYCRRAKDSQIILQVLYICNYFWYIFDIVYCILETLHSSLMYYICSTFCPMDQLGWRGEPTFAWSLLSCCRGKSVTSKLSWVILLFVWSSVFVVVSARSAWSLNLLSCPSHFPSLAD